MKKPSGTATIPIKQGAAQAAPRFVTDKGPLALKFYYITSLCNLSRVFSKKNKKTFSPKTLDKPHQVCYIIGVKGRVPVEPPQGGYPVG